jgi:hypothetical protein
MGNKLAKGKDNSEGKSREAGVAPASGTATAAAGEHSVFAAEKPLGFRPGIERDLQLLRGTWKWE